jgi:hypothetical protein
VVVDGLPPFAWRPEIVDQLVGRKCAVQRLDDGFTTMEDTSSFGLWVWTAAPHRIPKHQGGHARPMEARCFLPHPPTH